MHSIKYMISDQVAFFVALFIFLIASFTSLNKKQGQLSFMNLNMCCINMRYISDPLPANEYHIGF